MERSELFPGDSHHVETEDGYATSVSISYQRQRDMPYPVDGIASFCLLAADSSLDIQFKPRTFERPWVLNAGKGYTAVVESHRYVPGRQFNNFNGRYAGDPKANTSLLQAHAFDPNRTGQYYAVKRLASSKKARGNSKDMALQFDQLATELRIMAFPALRRHPNILSLLGSGHFLGEPVLILEDANCGNLAQFLTSPLIWPNRLFEMKMNLCLDVARGLKALHDHGVIHGDIKLENVLVVCNDVSFYNANRTSTSETACRNFTAKLCDFGFSIIVSDADSAQRSLKGFSRYWAAPEAATDKPIHMEMLPRTDIYSAGLVFASIFLEGVYPLKAFAKSVLHSHDEDHLDSFIAEIFPMPETDVKDLAKYALFHQELTKNISENTAISFGKMYCRFELEMISAILDKTLAKEAVLRPLTGGALFRFIEGIWRNRYDSQWREHRKECPGALAMHELNGSKFKMEVFTENFTKTPYPSGECTQCGPTCRQVPRFDALEVLDMRRAFGIFTATLTEDLCREIAFDFISKISVEVASSQQPNHARLVLLSHFFDGRIPGITSNSSSSALNLNKRNNAEVIKGMELRDFEVNDPSMTPCRFSQRSKAADGAYHIAIMCLDGLGTQRNAKRALEFLDLSVRLGSPQAKMDYPAILAATQPLGTSTSSAYDVAGNARLTSPGYIGQILGSGTVFNDSDQAELLTRHAKSLQPHLVGTSLQLLRTHAAESIEPAACKALISMTIMSRPRMILEGGAEWESKFTSILDMLVTKSVIEHFPKLTGKADNIDLLTFAAQRNDVALKWLINKYTNAELRLHFPRTFSETLPLAVSTNMNFGRSERVQMLLQLSPGNSLLSTSGLLPDLVHHRPSQVPIYGKHLKESGAGAALNEMNYFSETAFDVALQYGYIDVMKYLLEEGASYNECRLTPDFRIDQSLCSPLAMVLGSKIQVDFLMSLNPPPSLIVTASGMNVFHVLAGREPAAESESELDEQLDTFYAMEPGLIDASGGRDKLTPFHLVALHYATTVGAFLYSNGANINALDRMGRTPLDLLLLHGSPDQDYNFDPGMEDSQSKFICDYALAGPIYWHKEQTLQAAMIEKFVKWGAKRSSARPMGNETSVKSLKQDGFLQRVAAYPALEESESNGVGFVAGAFATTKPRNEIFVHPTVTSGVPKKRGTRFLDLFRKRNPRD